MTRSFIHYQNNYVDLFKKNRLTPSSLFDFCVHRFVSNDFNIKITNSLSSIHSVVCPKNFRSCNSVLSFDRIHSEYKWFVNYSYTHHILGYSKCDSNNLSVFTLLFCFADVLRFNIWKKQKILLCSRSHCRYRNCHLKAIAAVQRLNAKYFTRRFRQQSKWRPLVSHVN